MIQNNNQIMRINEETQNLNERVKIKINPSDYSSFEDDVEKKLKIKEDIGKIILKEKITKILNRLETVNNLNELLKSENDNKNKTDNTKKEISFYFLILQILAVILNLIANYEIITIMNAFFEIIKQDIFNRFVKTKKINFFEALLNGTLREIPEFEIEIWSSMIGGIILETLGLEITSSIFFIPNVICLFILFLFPFQKNENLNLNYSLFELIELTILYLILFISVGGGSLLIFQKFMSVTIKYFKQLCKINEIYIELISSYISVLVTLLSMFIKIYLNHIIIKQFDYSIQKRKFLLFIILIYIIPFIISFFLQFIFDYYRKEESFNLKCNCGNFIFCKCCYKYCCKKNLNELRNLTVLREKDGRKCEFCGYIYYEEIFEKTQVDSYNDSDLEIEDVEVSNGYSLIDLLEKKYSFNFYFKYKNIFSWFYKTFIRTNTWILLISNLFLKIQNIAINEVYLDLLENKYTYGQCYKDLKNLILEFFIL